MLRAHEFFLASAVTSVDVFSLVSAPLPDAVIVFGQPPLDPSMKGSKSGFMVAGGNSPSLIDAAASVAHLVASPTWVQQHAPGFVLPIRCAIAVRFATDRHVRLVSTLGSSTATAVLERGKVLPTLRIMPVMQPAHEYELVAPVVLRELVAQADESFERFLSDQFDDLSVEDFS